ncbi:MAG: chitobiase/beta-hexosaminidase C-terminal domain-containing protein, partial [Clostridia bacterium]|nr:chitobiase/beta-hexosaminidase C-terminal domain-containing protein [Clostridia bacterium]
MKKYVSGLLLLALLLAAFAGCNQTNEPVQESTQEQTTEPVGSSSSMESSIESTAPDTQPESGIFAPTGTAPVFSIMGGVYADKQELTLTAPEGTDYTVRYTTDGSVPTKRSGKFEDAISVPGKDATVIRAACFDADGNLVGRVITHTYIKANSDRAALYTVSLTLSPDDFDELCRHYTEKLEMPTHIEITNPAGELVISQDGGMRIFGGSSRALSQKSFKIIARKTG